MNTPLVSDTTAHRWLAARDDRSEGGLPLSANTQAIIKQAIQKFSDYAPARHNEGHTFCGEHFFFTPVQSLKGDRPYGWELVFPAADKPRTGWVFDTYGDVLLQPNT